MRSNRGGGRDYLPVLLAPPPIASCSSSYIGFVYIYNEVIVSTAVCLLATGMSILAVGKKLLYSTYVYDTVEKINSLKIQSPSPIEQKHKERFLPMKRPRTANQLANDERLRNKKVPTGTGTPPQLEAVKVPAPEQIDTPPVETGETKEDLQRQVSELKDMMIKVLNGQQNTGGISVGSGGRLVGEVEKYSVDVDRYPDFTQRLAQENRLKPMAFDYNYELDYSVSIRPYETKTGVNQKEPEFLINLYRIKMDSNGQPTNQRYIARRLMFHEDPQAAIVIARDNGLSLDDWKDMDNSDTNQRAFLNEMRYLRARDWLFDVFWPKGTDKSEQIREEVIGGTIVQVFTKNSEESAEIDFDKINKY